MRTFHQESEETLEQKNMAYNNTVELNLVAEWLYYDNVLGMKSAIL